MVVHDDPELPGDQLNSVDTILLGRITYELMAGYWPTVTDADLIITEFMNTTPKIVFSRTPEKVQWGNGTTRGWLKQMSQRR